MLDVPMIQTRGFRNRDGGFAVRIRLPYYRGLWASLIDGVTVTVDGEHHPADTIGWVLGDDEYTLTELTSAPDARWAVDVPATLQVPRAEPLAIGVHDVEVELRVRMSYIPEELQPTIWSEERRLVITR
jgi:hypothetical protein